MTRLHRIALLFFCTFLPCAESNAASELEERATIASTVRGAFHQEDFARLEEIARGYRTQKSRTPSGLWKLTLFYSGIAANIEIDSDPHERDPAFRAIEVTLAKWARQYPDSPTPHIIYSMALTNYAWAYRGSGTADTVRPQDRAPFQRYLSMARENLLRYKSVAAMDPRWYETMLIIARGEGWERDEFQRLLDEALNREPLFYQTYFRALEYLLPQWHGSTRDIEAFAREAVKRTVATEGQGMYARIYWYASQTEFDNDLFTRSAAAWPKMKSGFEDVIARYPDEWNLNNYTKFACLAQDAAQTRKLLKRIEGKIVAEAWYPPSLLRQCKDWSSSSAPAYF